MDNVTIEQSVETLTHNWWVVALRGVVALVFGALTIYRPGATLAALILLFGAYAVANGLFAIVAAIANRRGQTDWMSMLASGILSVAFGVLTFLMPGVTGLVLLYIIAGWAIFTGAAEVMTAVRLRRVITGEWLLIAAGVVSVIFGLLLVVFPGAGALAVTLWIGTYAIVVGILLIALALRLRSWGHTHAMVASRTT